MLYSVGLILVALVLYTLAIWSEKIKQQLRPWMLFTFICGFVCDLIGTSIMGVQNGGLSLTIHGICGILALIIMLIHLLWAVDALARGGRCQALFTKYSIYAWGVWLLAFVSGIPK